MKEVLLYLGALMSVITFAVHTFIGGPVVAKPLLANKNLPTASKWLNYYCWHNTTLLLLFFASGFVYVIFSPHQIILVYFIALLASALSILSAIVAIKGKINPFRFPSTSLFASIAFIGGLIFSL